MARVSIIRNKGAADKNGYAPINLRLVDKGMMKSVSTGFRAKEEQWDNEERRFTQGSGVKTYSVTRRLEEGGVKEYTNKTANDEISAMLVKANKILERYADQKVKWTINQFASEFKTPRTVTNFIEYAEKRLDDYGRGSNTASILQGALNDLKKHDSKIGDKDIKDITRSFIEKYARYAKNNGQATNTISMRLRAIRAVLYYARDKENIEIATPCPFGNDGGYKIKSKYYTKTANYIPQDLFEKMVSTQMDDSKLEESRHLFLFSVYACGMNFADMGKLTSKNIDYKMVNGKQQKVIIYTRSKTDEEMKVFVTDKIEQELAWFQSNSKLVGNYLLPIIVGQEPEKEKRTEYVNGRRHRFDKHLKAIAKNLDYPEALLNIGSYTARHTFAMIMRSRRINGITIPDAMISKAMGHKDQRTTKHYFAQFNDEEIMEATNI